MAEWAMGSRNHQNRAARATVAALMVILLAACGSRSASSAPSASTREDSASTLADADSDPEAVFQAWTEMSCNGSEFRATVDIDGEDPPAMRRRGWCKPSGRTDKLAYVFVLDSPEALTTWISTYPCSGLYHGVAGPTWYAYTDEASLATLWQQAGGSLVC